MISQPHFLEYFRAIGPTLIAVFVAYIAYQQWQINRANLREKLFERRFEVYRATNEFLGHIAREATVDLSTLSTFLREIHPGIFLFDDKMNAYLAEIQTHARKLRCHVREVERASDEASREKAINLEDAEIGWLLDQVSKIDERFEPFMGFGKHK